MARMKSLKRLLRAFRYRNYRLYFGGQIVSLMGTWMQQVAMSWLVYRLTDSAFLLGAVGFISQVPLFILTPFTGVLADRYSKHRILVMTQGLAMLQALAVAFLAIAGVITIWHILALSLALGIINAFDMPVRQSFVIEMVENKHDLANAIALNSALFNGTRLVGPSIAGMIIAVFGEGLCFLINGLSFIAVIAALLMMRIRSGKRAAVGGSALSRLKEGLRYSFKSPVIRTVLVLLAVISMLGLPFLVLMPVFARTVLQGGPHTLGFLMGAGGFGAFCGAVYLAARKSAVGLERVVWAASLVFSLSLAGFALSRWQPLSLGLLFFTGFGLIAAMASCNTILQTVVDDDKRGRVMSLFSMALMGTAPFGSLIAGGIASRIGAPLTVLLCAGLCLLVSVSFLPVMKVVGAAIRTHSGAEPTVLVEEPVSD
jgi:MFS family permease